MTCALGGLLASALLAGCGTEAIVVSEAAIADGPDARVVGWTAQDTPRQVFSPEDEEVTLHARFQFNYRAVYEWYRVDWIAPDGSPYKVVSMRTDFGSHRDIKASLKIRGKMASRMPGLWRARLWLQGRKGAPDRLLVARLFRIAEPTPDMLASGLASVDEPAASAERPLARRAPAPMEPETVIPAAAVSPMTITATAPAPPKSQRESSPPSPRREAQGIASVTLTAKPAAPGTPLRNAFRRDFPGCPPLYYSPGPGCVEQAPEE